MKTLYIISRSPFQRANLQFPLRIADKDDAILLISNGVILCSYIPGCDCISEAAASAKARGVRFYSVREDLEARGIEPKCDTVDYKGVVELITKYERVV